MMTFLMNIKCGKEHTHKIGSHWNSTCKPEISWFEWSRVATHSEKRETHWMNLLRKEKRTEKLVEFTVNWLFVELIHRGTKWNTVPGIKLISELIHACSVVFLQIFCVFFRRKEENCDKERETREELDEIDGKTGIYLLRKCQERQVVE